MKKQTFIRFVNVCLQALKADQSERGPLEMDSGDSKDQAMLQGVGLFEVRKLSAVCSEIKVNRERQKTDAADQSATGHANIETAKL